jgi:hypothetical protein
VCSVEFFYYGQFMDDLHSSSSSWTRLCVRQFLLLINPLALKKQWPRYTIQLS